MFHHVPTRSGALVLTELGIDDGSFAWKLCMDIVCLSFDGNLADAALIAAMGALLRLKLPGTRRIEDEIFVTEGKGHGVCESVFLTTERLLQTLEAGAVLTRKEDDGMTS